jgi:hypothetical protein
LLGLDETALGGQCLGAQRPVHGLIVERAGRFVENGERLCGLPLLQANVGKRLDEQRRIGAEIARPGESVDGSRRVAELGCNAAEQHDCRCVPALDL